MNRILAVASALVVVGTTSIASAESFARRPLTGPEHRLRIDIAPPDFALMDSATLAEGYGFRVTHAENAADEDENLFTLGIGLSFAFTHDFELGWKVLPIVLGPDTGYGDMELWARYRFAHSRNAEIGVQFDMQFPTMNASSFFPNQDDFGLSVGLPVRFHLGEVGRLDLGPEFEILFGDDDDPDDDSDVDFVIDLPLALSFNITRGIFLGARAALIVTDFNYVAIPVGGFVGGTVFAGRKSFIDLVGGFNVYFGDLVPDWQLHFGASIAIDL
jgi:hypothetical protein